MTGYTNYTAPTNASTADFAEDLADVYAHFDPLVGEKVATDALLPASGNYVGRRIWVEDTARLKVCAVLPSTWVDVGGPSNPRGRKGHAIRTSSTSVNATGSTVDVPGLEVTFTAEAGRVYRVTLQSALMSTVANDRMAAQIREGGTALAGMSNFLAGAAGSSFQFNLQGLVVNPSVGSHTYKASIYRVSGSGVVNLYADAGTPSFLLVEDIGSVS